MAFARSSAKAEDQGVAEDGRGLSEHARRGGPPLRLFWARAEIPVTVPRCARSARAQPDPEEETSRKPAEGLRSRRKARSFGARGARPDAKAGPQKNRAGPADPLRTCAWPSEDEDCRIPVVPSEDHGGSWISGRSGESGPGERGRHCAAPQNHDVVQRARFCKGLGRARPPPNRKQTRRDGLGSPFVAGGRRDDRGDVGIFRCFGWVAARSRDAVNRPRCGRYLARAWGAGGGRTTALAGGGCSWGLPVDAV